MTRCQDCAHYQWIIKNEAAPQVWYNHFCGHPMSIERHFDCVTGRTHTEQLNCRDVNRNGNCPRFKPKEEAAVLPVLEAHFEEDSP